jgi:hypothetical protein
VLPYIVAQVTAAVVAAGALWVIASGKASWVPGGFASAASLIEAAIVGVLARWMYESADGK